MSLILTDWEAATRRAVSGFWATRSSALDKKSRSGVEDRGERGAVTSGKNMDGFIDLFKSVLTSNGLAEAEVHVTRSEQTLPGFFRPTKNWDLLVTYRRTLVAVIELKSHVGPSFGNNFNNRAEEVIGSAHDLWTAYREGAFGTQSPPFVGWFMLVEDSPGSRSPINDRPRHFPVFPEFSKSSYLTRYRLLCQKLVREKLYSAASVIASPRATGKAGDFSDLSPDTSVREFVCALAAHSAKSALSLR